MADSFEFPNTVANWQPLTRPRASEVEDTRKQLHWAAQLVSALGNTLCDPRSDYAHTNLEWSTAHCGLLSQASNTSPSLRALLCFPDVSIVLLSDSPSDRGDGSQQTVATIPLEGLRFSEAMDLLAAAVAKQLGRDTVKLERPRHDLPVHPVDPDGAAAPFGGWKPHALVELTRWFSNGDRALRELRSHDARASEVRCWPHHFDIATLLVVEREDPADPSSEVTRSLGVGMTPGDGSYADAYWYVTPWPYPASPDLPALDGGGIWHKDGWVGAVLTSTALRNPQAERFIEFLRSALAACEGMLS